MSLYVKYAAVSKLTQESMTVSSDRGQFGDAAHLPTGFSDTPWATLEPQGWPLDGTRDILPDSPGNIGWWSIARSDDGGSLCDEDWNFPAIHLLFPEGKSFSAPGITFQFSPSTEEWCSEIVVTWYYSENGTCDSVDTTIAYPDSAEWFLHYPVDKFNRIDIEFVSTNISGHFAKLQQLQIGHITFFFQDELVRVNLLSEADPSACELSADELTVEIQEGKNRKLNIQKDHSVQLYRNDEIIASHYIKDYVREGENKIILKCQSVISILEDTFLGGFYNGELLDDVLSEVFGVIPYFVDVSLSEKTISGYLPVCTKREALQQIAFAIGAYVTTQGDGTIQIKDAGNLLAENPTSGFDKDNILSGSSLAHSHPPKEIQITSHKYTQSDEAEILVEDATIRTGENVFVFSEPHWGYEFYVEGYSTSYVEKYFTLEERPSWVRITQNVSNAICRLTGKKYVHTKADNRWTNPDASDFGGDTIKVENATLITDDNVDAVIERLKNYYSLTNSLNGTVVVDGQKAGNIVEIANPFGEYLTVGYITKMESEFTATGHTASIEVRGTERARKDSEVL